jgi:hypothetical protein
MVSAGDEVSASLLAGYAAASDMGLCRRAGCLPQLRRGSPLSVAHGRDIDNFLSIGVPQAPRGKTFSGLDVVDEIATVVEDDSDGQSRREAVDARSVRLPPSSAEPMMTAEKSHRFVLTGSDPEGRNRTIILWRELDLGKKSAIWVFDNER